MLSLSRHVDANQDDIFAKTVPILLHHTVGLQSLTKDLNNVFKSDVLY